ncbi:MAG: DUF1657 domain-containing protein [Bacillota bacterium]
MTVGKSLHQTLTSLEGAKSDYEQFAQATDDQQAQKMFQQDAQQLNTVISNLRNRVNYVEQEEPQYKTEQQMTGQKNQEG